MSDVAARTVIICVALAAGFSITLSQTRTADADRPVAYLTDHRDRKTTIRYADVLIQLALQPGTKIDPPSKDDLEKALQLVLNQRILEMPALDEADAFGWKPSEGDIDKKLSEFTSFFPSRADLVARLKLAGFDSLQDGNFRDIVHRRLYIDWYLDVHFRSAARPTPEVEEQYYKENYLPEFRRLNPRLLVPALDEVRRQISDTITREKINAKIERHLVRHVSEF